MGKNQSASNLPNIIQYSNGSINFVSGSTLLMQISSSGAITTTGVISGSNALSSSYASNSERLDNLDSTSFVFTSSYNSDSSSFSTRTTNLETASGSFSTRVTKIEGNYATTGSNIFLGAQTVCANITSTGTIIAQTLNVQQVTSSVVYSSGSNVFGCSLANTQQFTGSVLITGSLNVSGNTCVTSICSPAYVGGTFSGTTIYGSTAICGGVICGGATTLTGALNGTSAAFNCSISLTKNANSATAISITNTDSGAGALAEYTLTTNSSGFAAFGKNSSARDGAGIIDTCDTYIYSEGGGSISIFNNFSTGAIRFAAGASTSAHFTIASSGASCFASTVCAPTISMTGCIINTTDGGIFLKHCVNDRNFWVWQENSAGWGQFIANCNGQLSALGGLFAGSGLATFFTNGNAGNGIALSSLSGALNACGVVGIDHNFGNIYTSGCVAIGTTCAMDTLTVGNNGGLVLQRFSGATIFSPDLYFYGTRGTQASPTAKLNGDVAMGIRPRAYDGSTYLDVASIESKLEGVTATNVMFGNLIFSTNNGSTTLVERLRITPGGNVGIGTSTPEGRLHIQGCTSGYGANLVLLNFCNATGVSTGIDFGVDQSTAGCAQGNAQIKVCNIGAGLGGNAADMTFHTWNGAAFGERFRISCNGNIFVAGGTLTNSANYKAHTFCLFDATSIPGKTFTVSGNTQGCFSVTDFTGIPTSARAVLVYGWYHINGDGLAGQADHAVSWFGVQNNTSLQTWSSPTQPWPGETTTFRCCNFGTFVMEHDGDASATGMSNGMNYYGSWHQGIIGVDSGGCIKYNLAHGYSSGTHYNGLYAAGYWL